MLQLNNVNKTYRSKKGTDCKALRNVSLTLGEKGLTFLLGKSGSGKSTLLNIIGGLDKADSGEILYNGQSLQEFSANDLDNYRNVTVGFVFQEFNLLEQFNVYENIELVLKMQKLDFTPQDIENALERVGMQGYGKRAVSELSGGQKQRVAIARALLKQSKIILADEPTGNLDSETSAEIFELLKDISKEKLVIVVTHDRDSAEKYGDGIVEIKDGEIVKNTAPQESREAQESIKPTANKHKIPFVYKLRMALKNFGKHWVRSAITTLSIMLSLTVIVMSQVMVCWDTERNIAKTYTENGAKIIRLRSFDSSVPNGFTYSYVNENAVQWLTDNGYEFRRGMYADDADLWGIEFYGDRLPLEDGEDYYSGEYYYLGEYYYSDASVNSMFDSGYTFLDGSPIDISYEQMVGKTICKEIPDGTLIYRTIKGVYKSVKNLFDENWDGKSDLGKYLDSSYYVPALGKRPTTYHFSGNPRISTLNQYNDMYISCGNKTLSYGSEDSISLAEQGELGVGYTYYASIFGKNGYEDIKDPLADDEIMVSLELYNKLFPDDKIELSPYNYEEWNSYDDYLEQYKNLVPAHIGENIDIKYVRRDINETLLSLSDKKIIGVVLGGPNSSADITVAKDMIVNNLSQNYFIYGGENIRIEERDIYIPVTNYKDLKKVLDVMRDDFGIGVEGSPINFYGEEDANMRGATSMGIIAAVASVLCFVLMIGMMSFSIISRKKEIGIFKALGCKNSDIKLIFLLEVLLIGLIAAILAVVATNLFVYFVNASLISNQNPITGGITFIAMDWLSYIIILGASFFMTWLVSYLPLIKISRMKPVDAIKNL